MLPLTAALLPPAAIVPLIAMWMSITHKIEGGGWIPGTPLWKIARLLALAYIVTVVAHTLYGALVLLIARIIGARHLLAWLAIYAAFPTLLVLRFADTTVGLQDGLVHVSFAVVIALITWPFVRPLLSA